MPIARYGEASHACIVLRGGAVHVSNAGPAYRVAAPPDAYGTEVDGSATAAGCGTNTTNPSVSKAAAPAIRRFKARPPAVLSSRHLVGGIQPALTPLYSTRYG